MPTATPPSPAASTGEWVDFRLGYQPAFDGLRGIGVSSFVVYHGIVLYEGTLSSRILPGAFLWLELFFVQSGFLITSLLLEERYRTGSISLRNFYARRAVRLLPALIVVVGLTSAFLLTFSQHKGVDAAWREVWGGLFYVQNWLNAYSVNHVPLYLSHLWSLSVEEQFYVVAPIGMVALLYFGVPLRRIIVFLGIGALVSAGWMLFLERGIDDDLRLGRLYYATDTRAQGFFIGMALACMAAAGLVFRPATSRVTRAAGWTGAIVLMLMLQFTDLKERTAYRGGFLLCGLAVAAILVEVVQSPGGALSRLLSWRPFRFVGVMAYGVYLWHWPIMHVVRQYTDWSESATVSLQVSLTLVVATISYYALERPLLRLLSPRFARVAPERELAARATPATGTPLVAPAPYD